MIGITTTAAAVAFDLQAIPPALHAIFPKALTEIGDRLVRFVAQEKITTGGILTPRTGQLRRSLFRRLEVAPDGEGLLVRVGFDLAIAVYGMIQEFGGTITPKTAQYLMIPVGMSLTGNGVARWTAKEMIGNPFQFGFSGTFMNKARTMMFGKLPEQIVPLFAMKRSVTLPARAPLATSLMDNVETYYAYLQSLVDKALLDGLEGGGTA